MAEQSADSLPLITNYKICHSDLTCYEIQVCEVI